MKFTLDFIQLLLWGIWLILPLLLFFLTLIVVLGQVVSRIEGWDKFDSLYWSLITALTVGYGDIRPVQKSSKAISILIAFIGIMFAGVIVSITVTTATEAFKRNVEIHTILGPQGKSMEWHKANQRGSK